jgi:hypothetical protein
MRTVKGIYQNGVVTLAQPAPLKDKQEVTVLVPDEGEATELEALRFAGMLRDLSPEEIAAFDEALERGVRFERKVQP